MKIAQYNNRIFKQLIEQNKAYQVAPNSFFILVCFLLLFTLFTPKSWNGWNVKFLGYAPKRREKSVERVARLLVFRGAACGRERTSLFRHWEKLEKYSLSRAKGFVA